MFTTHLPHSGPVLELCMFLKFLHQATRDPTVPPTYRGGSRPMVMILKSNSMQLEHVPECLLLAPTLLTFTRFCLTAHWQPAQTDLTQVPA